MFTGAGLGAALAGLAGVAGGRAWEASQRPEDAILTVYPFRGERQAGITTPAQDNMFTAAFDVSATDVFNKAMWDGMQGIVGGTKTPDQIAASLQAAAEKSK